MHLCAIMCVLVTISF